MAQVGASGLRGRACRNNRRALVEAMLDRGAALNEPDAEPWATSLAWACKMGHEELAAFLRERGAVG